MQFLRRLIEFFLPTQALIGHNGVGRLSGLVPALFLIAICSQTAQSREQQDMQHPSGPPPSSAIMTGAAPPSFYGMVPKSAAQLPGTPGQASPGQAPQDAWMGQLNTRVPAGTVLTAILEQDLSSEKSKPNDVFTLLLQDGVNLNGKQLVPPNSKILGAVVSAASSKTLGAGHPGRLEIALHQLVTPDGRTYQIHAFISHNSNHDFDKEAKVDMPGHQLKDTGRMFGSFFSSFTAGVGSQLNKRHRGNEFEMERGEVIPVKLVRSLDCGAMVAGQPTYNPITGLPPSGVPGMAPQAPYGGMAPGAIPQGASAPPMARNFVPGLVDSPGENANPNNVFNQPVTSRPMADMPEPF